MIKITPTVHLSYPELEYSEEIIWQCAWKQQNNDIDFFSKWIKIYTEIFEMENHMASIKDVAEKANVGKATVSRVLNNSGYVSDETRRKILNAMRELDYTPNELARNLYHKRTGIVAILVPAVSHPYFGEFVEYAEAELYRMGFKAMICNASRTETEEKEYLEMLNSHVVDGIITGVHTLDVEDYKMIKRPIVALDRYLDDDIPIVAADHYKGGVLAAMELVRSGCRSVLHFSGTEVYRAPYFQRHVAFDEVMKKHNIKCTNYKLRWNRFDQDYVKQAIREVFESGTEFDGIFGVDLLAVECMNECARRGLRIPEDVKVVAYDGTYAAKIAAPRLTLIEQPIEKLARAAVRMVVQLIADEKEVENITLDVKLVKGETTY
ncbi:MAG: LacI family DNA-binding transcriptional regulator [Clostridiales bacterium]|nr:LacI family DNA-binding transcriptional regulator [Clostridiales bacterium]